MIDTNIGIDIDGYFTSIFSTALQNLLMKPSRSSRLGSQARAT